MSIQNLSRNDSIRCKITGHNQNECFLSIIGLDENPVMRLYDMFIPAGSIVLVSIRKISEDQKHIKVCLDSIMYSIEQDFAA